MNYFYIYAVDKKIEKKDESATIATDAFRTETELNGKVTGRNGFSNEEENIDAPKKKW